MPERSIILPAAGFFSLLLLACGGILFLAPLDFGRSPWESFDILVMSPEESLPAVRERLLAAGESPLDRHTATVEIEDFSGRREIPVVELSRRFEPDDPRLDPFVRAAPSLFVGRLGDREVNLLYLPRREERLGRRYLELTRLLEDHPFRLAGWDPVSPIVSGVTAFLVMIVALVTVRHRRWPVLLAIPPTVAYAVAGGPATLVRTVLVAVVWAFSQGVSSRYERELINYGSRPWSAREYRFLLFAQAIALVAAVFTFHSESSNTLAAAIFSFLVYLVALVAITMFAFTILRIRLALREHRMFLPLPIIARETRSFRSALVAVCVILVVSQVTAQVLHRRALGFAFGEDLVLPVPEQVVGETLTATRILEESRLLAPGNYPLSTSGYLAHRRFQESLLFGGEFAVPDLDEAVTLNRFVRDQGRIREAPESVITFDREWLERQLTPAPHSVYYLLTREGGVLVVSSGTVRVETLPLERFFFLVLVVLVGFGPLIYGIRLPYTGGIGTVGLASRRASQEA